MASESDIIGPCAELLCSLVGQLTSGKELISQVHSGWHCVNYGMESTVRQALKISQTAFQNDQRKDSLRYSNSTSKQAFHQNKKSPCLEQNMPFESKQTDLLTQIQKKKLHVSQIDNFLLQHQQFLPRPPFSAINTFCPAFKRLQQIKKQLYQKMSNPQFWLKYPNVIQDKQINQFYTIPDQDLLSVISQSTDECKKHSMILMEEEKDKSTYNYAQQKLTQNKDKLGNAFNKQNRKQSSFNQAADLCIQDEDSVKQRDHNSINQHQFPHQNKRYKEPFISIELPIPLTQMSFQHIASQVLKHLKILEESNNSRQSLIKQILDQNQEENKEKDKYKEKERSNLQNKQIPDEIQIKQITQQPLIQANPNLCPSQSHYLKSSQSVIPLTLSLKKQILHKFNQQQKQLMKKMIQSMILFRDFQNQIRVTKSRIVDEQSQKQQIPQQRIPESKKDVMMKSQNINKKVSFNFNSTLTDPKESLQSQNYNIEFGKLEVLMKDPKMKESIVDSLGLDSSNNSHSFICIVERQLG